jgi:hypothetical protein
VIERRPEMTMWSGSATAVFGDGFFVFSFVPLFPSSFFLILFL